MNWSKLRSKNIFVALAAMATSIVFYLCTNFASVNAFEIQSESKTKEGLSRETISFNGQVRDPGWLSVKFDGSVLDLNPTRGDAFTSYGYKLFEPAALEKNSVTDTRVTLGMWDNWVRWTSRQAASNYMTPGTDLTYLRQTGLGFNNFATSQRIETGIFKTDSMRLSSCPFANKTSGKC